MQKKQNPKLFVDMDGTIAAWKSEANFEALFVKGYFYNLVPYWEVLKAVKKLKAKGIKVYILSAYLHESEYALQEKNAWLDKYLPEIPAEDRIFCTTAEIKANAVKRVVPEGIDTNCFLLDDYSKNLNEWTQAGGTSIKLYNGINGTRGTQWQHKISRYQDHIAETLEQLIVK